MRRRGLTLIEPPTAAGAVGRRGAAAFTLIELLVVIAIIAILAALLMPALEKARDSARRAACMGNIHQWHLGIEMFANSHGGYYPGIVNHGQSETGCAAYRKNYYPKGKTWMDPYSAELPDYIHKKVTLCPAAPSRPYPLMPYGSEGCEWYQASIKAEQLEWQYNPDPDGDPATTAGWWWGITDYAIRVGFGSLHDGVGATRYLDPDPNYYRGHHKCMYSRWSNGFVFNYRQNQPDAHSESIMLMDRQRSPDTQPWDGGRYMLVRANHADGSGVGAAGANALLRNGQVRWMDLTAVWARADWSSNYYGTNGYAEGAYPQYVDDEIAEHW